MAALGPLRARQGMLRSRIVLFTAVLAVCIDLFLRKKKIQGDIKLKHFF